MELSFAIARSKDKQCGLCMGTVLGKQPTASRDLVFSSIAPNASVSHVFENGGHQNRAGRVSIQLKCFYLHMNPDGTKAEPKARRRRQRRNAVVSLDYQERMTFRVFFQERQERLQNLLLMLKDGIASLLINLNFFSDSEKESDDEDVFLLF
ncbi:hypothetical protein MAR_012602 [Mya arenaria]|uniref:Uncharacterized protein n=1 Tax=Mya arenaria TaxID=6604 RepID=A0ABY7FXG0_MYAAR|nr:hypothetical protein MAR_012602 [Mya arenaria]